MCTFINNSIINNTDIIEVLQSVFDPDIHHSVYDMGLIYQVTVKEEDKTIHVLMTLTSVNCPEAQSLPLNIETSLKEKFIDYTISVELTFEPEWTVDNMSEEILLKLNLL